MARWWRFWRRRPVEPAPEPWYPNVRIFDVETDRLLWKQRLEPGQTSWQMPDGIIQADRPYRIVAQLGGDEGFETGESRLRYSPTPDNDETAPRSTGGMAERGA